MSFSEKPEFRGKKYAKDIDPETQRALFVKGLETTIFSLSGNVARIASSTGQFSIADFCRVNKIRRRRMYDVTDVMVVLRLFERKSDSKTFRWLGLDGMRQACADFLVADPKQLLVEMFDAQVGPAREDPRISKPETTLTRITRFLACFYVHGFYTADHEKVRKSSHLMKAVKEYIVKTRLGKRLGLEACTKRGVATARKTEKNVFRRIYDVVNVFVSVAFYKCADSVVGEMCDGQFTVTDSSSPVKLALPSPAFSVSDPDDEDQQNEEEDDDMDVEENLHDDKHVPVVVVVAEPPGFFYTGTAFPSLRTDSRAKTVQFTTTFSDKDASFGESDKNEDDERLMNALCSSHADNFVYSSPLLVNDDDAFLFEMADTTPFVF